MVQKNVHYVGKGKYQSHRSVSQQVLCSLPATYALREGSHSLFTFYNMLNSETTGLCGALTCSFPVQIGREGGFVLTNRTVTGTQKRSHTEMLQLFTYPVRE